MKKINLLVSAVGTATALLFPSTAVWTQDAGSMTSDATRSEHSSSDAFSLTQDWPPASRTAAALMIEKHGQPDARADGQLIWTGRLPWLRIVVYRASPNGSSPILEESVNYPWVPADAPKKIVFHDSTVQIDIDKLELIAIGNNEENNILALNLTNDVLERRRSVRQARSDYNDFKSLILSGKTSPYTEGLMFMGSQKPVGEGAQGPAPTTIPEKGNSNQ